MYYKIENTESEVYQKLFKMRAEELQFEMENNVLVKEIVIYPFEKFYGYHGQQNFYRVTRWQGFVFTTPDEVCLKTWKRMKDNPEVFVPNTRTKLGKEMDNFLKYGLQTSCFESPLEILGIEYEGRFKFPVVHISDDIIYVFIDDNYEPQDPNLIQITRKEFNEKLNITTCRESNSI